MVAAEWAQMWVHFNSTNEAIASPTESWIGGDVGAGRGERWEN